MDWHTLGKGLIIGGLALTLVGLIVMSVGRLSFLGKLPGDLLIRRDHFSFYFPLTTCLFLSLVLTLVLHFINRK